MPTKDIVNSRVRSLFVGGAVALVCASVVISAGATVIHGIAGFGASRVIHTAKSR